MTKLYHGPDLQGWQIPGQQDRKAVRIDVPSAPAELATWLNDRYVSPDRNEPTLAEILAHDEYVRDVPPAPPAPVTSPIASHIALGDTLAIESWILDDATPIQIEKILGAIGVRFHELRKAAGK